MQIIIDNIPSKIHTIRGIQVMLDRDLAELYQVETKRINEAVKNNPDKFPEDFYFELTNIEFDNLRSKISTANISKIRTNPKAFTEQGIYMLATILKSKVASDVTISLIKTFAKEEIILIDNYLDDTVFTLFSKVPNIQVTIYTNIISKQLKLDYEKYAKQYNNTTLKTFKNSHDRFLILDKKEIFHIGASLKDLGKKWFAFSKINIDVDDLLSKLN